MEITKVSIYKNEMKNLKAFATIELDSEFVIKGLKVLEGKNGIYVSMPSTKGSDGQYYDDCFPITADCRNYINETVLEEYEKQAAEQKEQKTTRSRRK